MAHRQTAARGRRGRPWASPEGNFAATLILHPQGGPAGAALRSFVASLALADALRDVTNGKAATALKWPNDVLLNGGKVAGILLESGGSAGRLSHLLVGIGVNLAAAPPPEAVEEGALRPVSVLGETGVAVTPEALLDALAPAFARWEATLATGGFAPVREAWLARAARLGQPVTARTMTETVSGRFETIDATGALVLDTGTARRAIPAADVYF
jgi:BirA family biotin operon repressor/biotin-[acetyl-CoA-carboxylase] ligase